MTQPRPGLDFRDMTEADLADGLWLSRASGWNQTLDDWRLLLSLGPGLFRVAAEGTRVVASGGAVRYGGELAWVCMILVEPERRGQGIGTRVFDEVLARCDAESGAGTLAALGLDATPAGRGIYRQRGFVDGPGLTRMRAEPGAPIEPPAGVERLTPQGLDRVLALDREVFGADRGRVLRLALERAPELAFCVHAGARLAGYCLGRHGDHSLHAGPLVAEDAESARDLARAALAGAHGRALILDARVDAAWLATLGELGFREQRSFTRMYRDGVRPSARAALEHAVVGPEFG